MNSKYKKIQHNKMIVLFNYFEKMGISVTIASHDKWVGIEPTQLCHNIY